MLYYMKKNFANGIIDFTIGGLFWINWMGPGNHRGPQEWKKAERQVEEVCNFICITFWRRQNYIDRKQNIGCKVMGVWGGVDSNSVKGKWGEVKYAVS